MRSRSSGPFWIRRRREALNERVFAELGADGLGADGGSASSPGGVRAANRRPAAVCPLGGGSGPAFGARTVLHRPCGSAPGAPGAFRGSSASQGAPNPGGKNRPCPRGRGRADRPDPPRPRRGGSRRSGGPAAAESPGPAGRNLAGGVGGDGGGVPALQPELCPAAAAAPGSAGGGVFPAGLYPGGPALPLPVRRAPPGGVRHPGNGGGPGNAPPCAGP